MINKDSLTDFSANRSQKILTVLTFGFVLFVLFYNLGGHFLEDWDEGFYVVMSQTAIQNSNYLTLEYQNDIHWSKTPFPLYPMIASFKVFGVNEFSARLSSVFFSLGLLFQIYLIAKRYYGEWTALLAILITITTAQFIFFHGLKTANVDAITLFFLTGAISSWLLIRNPDYRIIMTFASLAFSFLCKGPIVSIPIIVICLSFFIENPIKRDSVRPILIGLSVAAIIVLPWYIYAYMTYGDIFIKKHILYNFLQRYTAGIEGHIHEDLYYIRNLFSTGNFIWIGAAMVSLVYFLGVILKGKRPIDFMLLSWVSVTFIIVNFSQTKLWYYLYPIYPALAIITAKTLLDFVENPGFLNQSAFYIGFIPMLISDDLTIFGFHPYIFHKLFFDIFDVNKTKIAALLAGIIFIGAVFLLKRYLPHYQKKFRILLVCMICIIPISETCKLTIKKDLNAPILSLAKKLDFTKPVYALTVSTYTFPPGAYYYLSRNGEVKICTDFRKFLKGETVVMQTVSFEVLQKYGTTKKNEDGSLEFVYRGDKFKLTPIENSKGFTIVKIE